MGPLVALLSDGLSLLLSSRPPPSVSLLRFPQGECYKAFDANSGTYWTSTGGYLNQWVMIRFKRDVTLTRMVG